MAPKIYPQRQAFTKSTNMCILWLSACSRSCSKARKNMIRKTRLFTPGPTPLLPAAQFAMAAADMHHRTAEFRALYQKVLAQLKVFVGTQNDVLLLSCSGTGAMEASVSNLTSPGDRVLVLTAGKFGERWVDLAKAFGCAARRGRGALRPDLRSRRHQGRPQARHQSHLSCRPPKPRPP